MSGDDKEAKTENPTEKRKSDFHEQGKIAFSRELPVFASLFVLAVYLGNFAQTSVEIFATRLATSVVQFSSSDEFSSKVELLMMHLVSILAVTVGPFVVFLVLASVISAIQHQPRVTFKRIMPEWSRISPIAGVTRLLSINNAFEFLKSLGKIFLASCALAYGMNKTVAELVSTALMPSYESAKSFLPMATFSIWTICVVAGTIAAIDFFWQRKSWLQNLRMTKQEVKDEFKQSDGDPIVKSRLRAIARDKSRKRMMQSVPSATLIIANPTHIAVALRYDPSRDAAPLVIAIGADLIAQKIREIAAEHDVPVFQRVELARALYRGVKVNQVIPAKFYAALAELIRIINARSRAPGRGLNGYAEIGRY